MDREIVICSENLELYEKFTRLFSFFLPQVLIYEKVTCCQEHLRSRGSKRGYFSWRGSSDLTTASILIVVIRRFSNSRSVKELWSNVLLPCERIRTLSPLKSTRVCIIYCQLTTFCLAISGLAFLILNLLIFVLNMMFQGSQLLFSLRFLSIYILELKKEKKRERVGKVGEGLLFFEYSQLWYWYKVPTAGNLIPSYLTCCEAN